MNTLITLVNQWGDRFVPHASAMMMQAAVLIGILWLLDKWLYGRMRASIRYGLWMLVLVKLVLSPYLSYPTGVGHWIPWLAETPVVNGIGHLNDSVLPSNQTISLPLLEQAIQQTMLDDQLQPIVNTSAEATVSLTWQGITLVGWLMGVLTLSVGLLLRALSIHRIIRFSEAPDSKLADLLKLCQQDMNVFRDIELRLTEAVPGPAVCRAWRPVILLPKVLVDRFPEDKLRAVLFHELCHIKRADLWINWAQTLVQVFYFYNPLLWWANANIRRVREQAVDEAILVCTQGRMQWYSHTLIDIAEVVTLRPGFGLGLIGVAESKTRLNERIKLMLNKPNPKGDTLGAAGLAFIVALGMILLPMAAAQSSAELSQNVQIKDEAQAALFAEVRRLEASFHALFPEKKAAEAIDYYTEDATLMIMGYPAFRGKEAIAEVIEKSTQETPLIGLKQDFIQVSGNENLIYVVNLFNWTMKDPDTGEEYTIPGKGVHVWQRQPDGSWKILIDADNSDIHLSG